MKQANAKNQISGVAALYVRVSRDDELDGESSSITNQIKLLTHIAKEKGYTEVRIFSDDGITGTSEKRPSFQQMLSEIERGIISAVFVKDMSRLTRDQAVFIELTRKFFPKHDIRLVSVADGTDTAEREDELAPFRGLMNEMYAQDISKKRRATNKIKGHSGEPLSPPPYGYKRDENNPKRWVVDDEAASVVRRVFRMALEGAGTEQIAAALSADHILTPTHYWTSKGVRRSGKKASREPYHWNSSTIWKMLTLQEYCGDVINFKTYSKSFWLKERFPNAEENMAVFRNVHEPIVDRQMFEKIARLRGKIRRRPAKNGERSPFSGLLVCADCGHTLHYHFNQTNPNIKYFNCSNYTGNRGNCTATHYVRVDFLEEVVLGEIRRLTAFAKRHEQAFAEIVMGHSIQTSEEIRRAQQQELYAKNARVREIDRLIGRIYEDNVAGKITDERFVRMTSGYEREQKELLDAVKALASQIEKESGSSYTTEDFISTVRKYTRAKKLTPAMLSELVDHIEVFHAERVDGKKTQRINIHYNCVGLIQIPEQCRLPELDVSIHTRQGVAVNYAPMQQVM